VKLRASDDYWKLGNESPFCNASQATPGDICLVFTFLEPESDFTRIDSKITSPVSSSKHVLLNFLVEVQIPLLRITSRNPL
jgi:hypothetical protein